MLLAPKPFYGIRLKKESTQMKHYEETYGKSGERCALSNILHTSSKI